MPKRLKVVYLTIAANDQGGVDVACSDPALGGGPLGGCPEMTRVRNMAWDVMAAARLRGARVGGQVQADRVNPVLLIGLANALLEPEQFGHAVTREVRDMARMALGRDPIESRFYPYAATPASVGARGTTAVAGQTATPAVEATVAVATDWSAA